MGLFKSIDAQTFPKKATLLKTGELEPTARRLDFHRKRATRGSNKYGGTLEETELMPVLS